MRNVKRTLVLFAIVLLSLVALTSASVLAATPKVASVNAAQNTPLKTESVKQKPETKVSEADKETKQNTESQSVVESESTETKSSLTSSEVESTEKPSEEKEVSDIEDRLKSELSEKGQVELTDHEAKVLAGSNYSGFRNAITSENGELKVEGSKLGTIYYSRGEVGRYYDDIYVTTINGKVVFCIEPMTQWVAGTQYSAETLPDNVTLENKATLTPTLDAGRVNIDKNTRLKLEQIVQYGYYDLPSRQNAGFTQALLWENMGFKLLNEGYIAENQQAYDSFKEKVNAKIAAWKNTPSWNGKTVDLQVGKSVTLTDTNGVFNKLKLPSEMNGVTLERKGNDLTLTATATAKTGEFLLKQDPATLSDPVSLLYKRPGAQTFASLFFRDPVSGLFNLNILPSEGQITLVKKDHEVDNYLSGAVFNVLDSQGKVVDTLTTDANGKATSKKLPLGHYQVVEVKSPSQYILDNKKYEVELTNSGKATPLVQVSKTILNKEVPPTIGTTLTDGEGEKQVDPLQEVVLKDVVKVTGAIVGKFYDLVGTLKVVETGEDLLYNGKKVTASTRVQAKTKDFFAELFFKFDARSLKGKKVVAFEDLYTNGRHVASEAKLDNPSQTVRIRNPKIHTTATINGKKEVEAGQPYTVEDVVRYEDFSPGKYYRLSGLAAYPDTKELIRINGSIPKGTVTFKAESENGKATVPIYFESTEHLSGKSAVILEEAERLLVSKDATDDEVKKAKGESVAEHKDYKDYGQTVTFTPPTPPVTPPTPPTPPHTPELPKTGESTNAFILVGGLLLMLGMFVLPKRKEV